MTNTRNLFLAFIAVLLSPMAANATTITFDVAEGNYTPTPGVIQNVTDEFAPLGVIFQDALDPLLGATLGNCGPGNGPVSLFGAGNDFPGCGDTTPDLNILFVNPLDSSQAAWTDSVSIFNFDGLIKMTAFDFLGNELGSTQLFSGLLSLSGIGQISMINLLSLDQDPTTMDDLTFGDLTPIGVPEPGTLALLGIGLFGMGLARRRKIA